MSSLAPPPRGQSHPGMFDLCSVKGHDGNMLVPVERVHKSMMDGSYSMMENGKGKE